MGFLNKLGKKKASATVEEAVTTGSNIKAPIIMVEDASVDDGRLIARNDSIESQKSLEPDGIKTMESRDPEEIQPVASTTGSKPDAPASRNLVNLSAEPRDPEGTVPPKEITTTTLPEPVEYDPDDIMTPPVTPHALLKSPKSKNAATDFFDSIGKTLSNVCMLGGGARPMEEEFEDDDDDSSRASGATSSTLGQESTIEDIATRKEEAAAGVKGLTLIEENDVDEAENKESETKEDSPSLVDKEAAVDDEKVVENVAKAASAEATETPTIIKGLFGWCAACKSTSATTGAVVGTAAAVGGGAAALAVVNVDEEKIDAPVVAVPSEVDEIVVDDEEEKEVAQIEDEEVETEEVVEETLQEEEAEVEAEAEEAATIPAVATALSDGSKRSKRSRASIISAAMSRFSRKSAVPDEVATENDMENLQEIPGMVRFMSHTERIERGFEVLLKDFSGYMRQCGHCEIKDYDNVPTEEVTMEELEAKASLEAEMAPQEEEALVREESIAHISVADFADVPVDEAGEREDTEDRQVDDEEVEGRDDEQPDQVAQDVIVVVDQPTVASKQSKASRFSLRSILAKKSNSHVVKEQASNVPVEVDEVVAVASKAMSNLSHASENEEEMGPEPAAEEVTNQAPVAVE
ncbi:hypothetical protein MPSEU_000982300 [Mayamaea pseudoterrestris]|nr:hypothetical protein MPSEU_000982300 [Mayamaea pseudoterrestris]